jgi:hypothetical protein
VNAGRRCSRSWPGPGCGQVRLLEEAFVGQFTEHHAFLLRTMAARIDEAGAYIAAVEARIEQVIAPFATVLDRLDEITGLGADGAATVFAETGWTCPGSPPQRICVPGPGCTARWLSTCRCDAAVLLEVESVSGAGQSAGSCQRWP